jgi:GT2 family glycosyltransferase
VNDGSIDDTANVLEAERHRSNLHVIQGDGKLWWGGAMALAINYILESSADSDYILLMNDDVLIEPNFVSTLVQRSRVNQDCVVAPITRSTADGSVIGTGYRIDYWRARINPAVDHSSEFFVDALAGRGVLIPTIAARTAGTVDSVHFPHYLGDIEYTARIQEQGFPLLVTNAVNIFTSPESSDMEARRRGLVTRRFHIKSKSRAIDRIRFFLLRGPAHLRWTSPARWILMGMLSRLSALVSLKR